MPIRFEFRDMTDAEYKQEQESFDEQSKEYGNSPERQERMGFVAANNGRFIGASSGLAQKLNDGYGAYFYLTDLFVEKEYRKNGYGEKLLKLLEEKIKEHGIEFIWTWTAEYEAETFYLKQGYEEFVRFEGFYVSGHARVGLIKEL
jgi:GNAT superfamily N-acetyltransferase